MKTMATISTMILAAGLAVAQSAPAQTTQKKPAAPASQNATGKSTTPAKPAAAPAAKTTTPKTATKTAAKTPAATPAVKPASAQSNPNEEIGKGKRDPFVSPVITRIVGAGGPSCSSGPHCLIIDQVTVEGVVCKIDANAPQTGSGSRPCKEWIAVLANPAKKVYYLRANDQMFDGYIERIDGKSVVFMQNVIDAMGRQTKREVVKSLAPSV